jgi:hypothetical protein
VWERLRQHLLAELRAAGEIEWSRAVADSSHVQAKKGAPRRGRARLIESETAQSIINRPPQGEAWRRLEQARELFVDAMGVD